MIRYKISKIWALRWTLSWPRPRSSGGALHCSLLFWWERMRYMALRHAASHLVFAPPPPCSSSSSLFRWCCHPKTPSKAACFGDHFRGMGLPWSGEHSLCGLQTILSPWSHIVGRGREGKTDRQTDWLSGVPSYKDTWGMSTSKPNYIPNAPSPNTMITLGVRASATEFGGDTV